MHILEWPMVIWGSAKNAQKKMSKTTWSCAPGNTRNMKKGELTFHIA
jgi:hypothetical protein